MLWRGRPLLRDGTIVCASHDPGIVDGIATHVYEVKDLSVREILQMTEGDIQMVNNIEIVPYRDGVLPVFRLADFFKLPPAPRSTQCLLVVVSDRGSVGLLAEEILGQREVVVRPLRDPLIQVPGISGATELGDGKAVLILDGAALTSGVVSPPGCHWTDGTNN